MAGEGRGGAPQASDHETDGADLAVLLRHERGGPAQPVLEALLDKRAGEVPEVQQAAHRLLRRHAPEALDLAASAAMLIQAAGDERTQRLFAAWCLRPDGRSQGQLGQEEGVSATRVGQIAQGADRRIRAALAVSQGALSWTVHSARRHLGAATTEHDLSAVLVRLGATGSPAAELVPWLAGPYFSVPRHPGWLAVEPRQLVNHTQLCLGADGGVRRLADVRAELADLGIAARQLVPWLRASGAVVVHDLAVVVTGPLADAVERILDARGVPGTIEEIAADLAAGGRVVEPGALNVALRQRRFARTVNGAVRLAAWPQEERPAARPRHRRPSQGRRPQPGRERGVSEPAANGSAAKESGGVDSGSPARLWLWVRVDADVLHGSDAAVPVALAERLGLVPLTRRTFSSRWGPVTLAYDGPQPTRGSVRAVALAAGARSDDTLLLGFSRSCHDVAVEVRRGSVLTSPPDATSTDVALFPEIATGGTH